MIPTLTKGSGGTFQVSARRYTDPWGTTRVGASSGSPNQRYCASLGHRQDDERGLTYMRARYYEPTTGRFLNQDPERDGVNWFAYGRNAPTMLVDPAGTTATVSWLLLGAGLGFIALGLWGMRWRGGEFDTVNRVAKIPPGLVTCIAGAALLCFTAAAWYEGGDGRSFRELEGIGLTLIGACLLASIMMEAGKVGARGVAGVAIFASVAYAMRLLAELVVMDLEAMNSP